MIAVEKVMTCFALFYPMASATAYGQRPKFFRAEHSATAKGENCAYGPTLSLLNLPNFEFSVHFFRGPWTYILYTSDFSRMVFKGTKLKSVGP